MEQSAKRGKKARGLALFSLRLLIVEGCHLFEQFERFLGLILVEDSDGKSGMDQDILAQLRFRDQDKTDLSPDTPDLDQSFRPFDFLNPDRNG